MMRSRNADYDRINERRNILLNQFVANLARSIPSTPSKKQRGNKKLSKILSLGLGRKESGEISKRARARASSRENIPRRSRVNSREENANVPFLFMCVP